MIVLGMQQCADMFGKFWFCAFMFVVPYFANFWIFSNFPEILVLVGFCSVLSAGLADNHLHS